MRAVYLISSEVQKLKQHNAFAKSHRGKTLLEMETFLSAACKLRGVRRPWLHVMPRWSGIKRNEACIMPEQNMIVLACCSWYSLLHEWHHWIIGWRYGWEHTVTPCADKYAEAYAIAANFALSHKECELRRYAQTINGDSVRQLESMNEDVAAMILLNLKYAERNKALCN